jgi:hypothetical protein
MSSSHDATISFDNQRLLFIKENQPWVADLATGEWRALSHDSQKPCCTRWAFGRSDLAIYAFEPAHSDPLARSAITMTVVRLDSAALRILDEKRLPGVSRSASLSPNGLLLAYDDSETGWIHRWDQGSQPFDITEYGLSLPRNAITTNPAWSPDGNQISWTISGFLDGQYQTGLALFDLDAQTAR